MNNTTYNESVIRDYQAATESNPYQRVIVTNHLLDSIGDITDKTILDIGCGFGRHIKSIIECSPNFKSLIGVDKSPDQIEICKNNFKSYDRVEFYPVDILDDKIFTIFGKNSFDIVYNNFVISYCSNIAQVERFLINCYELLKPKGTFVLIYNNHKNGLERNPLVYDVLKAGARLLTKDGEFYEGCPMESRMSKDCAVFINYYSDEFIVNAMRRIGFKDCEVKNVYLEDKALEGYTMEELNIMIDSKIFILIKARKA